MVVRETGRGRSCSHFGDSARPKKYIGLAALKDSGDEEVTEGSGLLGGITAWHLRMLVENPWEGGGGYTLNEVGQMTLDQMWSRLCDIDVLKRDVGGRTEKVSSLEAASSIKPDSEGMLRGRAADGTEIRGRIRGKSKARELMELAQKKKRRKK